MYFYWQMIGCGHRLKNHKPITVILVQLKIWLIAQQSWICFFPLMWILHISIKSLLLCFYKGSPGINALLTEWARHISPWGSITQSVNTFSFSPWKEDIRGKNIEVNTMCTWSNILTFTDTHPDQYMVFMSQSEHHCSAAPFVVKLWSGAEDYLDKRLKLKSNITPSW